MRLSAVLLFSALSIPAFSQTAPSPAPAPKPPTSVEVVPKVIPDDSAVKIALLTEENLQLKGQAIASQEQTALAPLQASYNDQEKVIADWEADVKKKNGWLADVTYDRTTKKFMRAVPAVTTPVAEKK